MLRLKINRESGLDGVCPFKEEISNSLSQTLQYNLAFFHSHGNALFPGHKRCTKKEIQTLCILILGV